MSDLEDVVEAAVRNLAARAPIPHDLATAARVRGRRLRRRRQAAIGTAALALILVAAAPLVITPAPPPPPPADDRAVPVATTPAPPPGDWPDQPYELPGGVVMTALTRTDVGGPDPAGRTVRDGNVVLDRDTGRYRAIQQDYYQVWGAPAGSTAVVTDGSGNLLALDGRDAVPRPVADRYTLDPQWSPDGERLLITGENGYTIWTAATGRSTSRDATEAMSTCPDFCFFTWLPNGTEIALARVDPAVPQSEDRPDTVKDVAVYSAATGKQVRILPVPGVPTGPDSWSADGNLVLTMGTGDAVRVVDVRTGKTTGQIPGSNVHFLPDGRILSIRQTQAEVYDTSGTLLVAQELPADFADRTMSIGRP